MRAVALRLSPTVHATGDHGFSAVIAATALRTGFSGYVDDGANRWPAIRRSDAARLVRLALKSAAPGTVLYGVAEEGIPTRESAAAHAAALGVPARSVPAADAAAHFGWIGAFWAQDIPSSNALTRERLGWTPTGPTLLEDIAAGVYANPSHAL